MLSIYVDLIHATYLDDEQLVIVAKKIEPCELGGGDRGMRKSATLNKLLWIGILTPLFIVMVMLASIWISCKLVSKRDHLDCHRVNQEG